MTSKKTKLISQVMTKDWTLSPQDQEQNKDFNLYITVLNIVIKVLASAIRKRNEYIDWEGRFVFLFN